MTADFGVQALRQLLAAGDAQASEAAAATGADPARCELCNERLEAEHGHLVDLDHQSLRCVCRACRLLFTPEGAGKGRFRAVPDRWAALHDMAAEGWTADVPVGLAFFVRSSASGRVAVFYPSPAGATESLVAVEDWDSLAARHMALATLEPDVEALLVRSHGGRREAFIVPVDVCYELVGAIRRHWRGFQGGAEADAAVERLFARVRVRSGAAREAEGA